MKKYLLLLIALIPFTVFAQNYTIKTKVGVEGKTIEEGEFDFNLLDKDGNVVQTKKNDKDGNIVFDPISWNSNGVTTWVKNSLSKYETTNNLFHIYTIKQADNGLSGYTLDNEVTYVMVSNEGSKVTYLKYPSKERIEAEKVHYEWNPFHATDSQLQGIVYIESDLDTHVLRVFRDVAGKYSDNQHIGNKIYSIMSESDEGKNTINSAIDDDYSNYTDKANYKNSIKKIIIENPIRPVNGEFMFGQLSNLEEIVGWENLDTSRMTTMNYMFSGVQKLKVLDLTHFDFSGLTDVYGVNSFYNTSFMDDPLDEYEVRIGNLNIPGNVKINDMFLFTANDQYVNVKTSFDWFNNTSLSNHFNSAGYMTNYDTTRLRYFFRNANVKYFDLSKMKIHLVDAAHSPSGRGGLDEFINSDTGYYFDISGITTDMCAYASSDIRIGIEDLRILKISDQNSSRQGLIKNTDYGPIYLYNVDNNLVSSELTEVYGGSSYLISDPNSYNYSDCDRYYHGGTWLNIVDDSVVYLNKYVKPEVKGVNENPKTGINKHIVLLVLILLIGLFGYKIINNNKKFKNI